MERSGINHGNLLILIIMFQKKGNLVMINNSLHLPNRVELLMLRKSTNWFELPLKGANILA